MISWLIGHVLPVCIGISLGLMGGGGSVLAVPILVYIMGISPKPAIAMTLLWLLSASLVLFPTRNKGMSILKPPLCLDRRQC